MLQPEAFCFHPMGLSVVVVVVVLPLLPYITQSDRLEFSSTRLDCFVDGGGGGGGASDIYVTRGSLVSNIFLSFSMSSSSSSSLVRFADAVCSVPAGAEPRRKLQLIVTQGHRVKATREVAALQFNLSTSH